MEANLTKANRTNDEFAAIKPEQQKAINLFRNPKVFGDF
jgi:hypothetical protein